METIENKLSVRLTCLAQSSFFPQRGLGMFLCRFCYPKAPPSTWYHVSCFMLSGLYTTSQELSCWYTVWYAMRFICNHEQHSLFEGHSQQSSNSCLNPSVRSTECDCNLQLLCQPASCFLHAGSKVRFLRLFDLDVHNCEIASNGKTAITTSLLESCSNCGATEILFAIGIGIAAAT